MRLRIIRAFLKKSQRPILKQLALSILQEVIEICEALTLTDQNASMLLKEAQFLSEKLAQTDDETAVKRMMQNFRDQVALRTDVIKENAESGVEQRALYRLDMFLYKTQ